MGNKPVNQPLRFRRTGTLLMAPLRCGYSRIRHHSRLRRGDGSGPENPEFV